MIKLSYTFCEFNAILRLIFFTFGINTKCIHVPAKTLIIHENYQTFSFVYFNTAVRLAFHEQYQPYQRCSNAE